MEQDGEKIRYVRNPSKELYRLAVKNNGCALKYIKDQDEEICKIAIQHIGRKYHLEILEYVNNQT